MNTISEQGLRAAMLDSILQQDKETEKRLIERLRENNAEVVRIQRQIKHLCQELLTVQRRSAAIADALSLEAQR